jgi:oligopeptidase B
MQTKEITILKKQEVPFYDKTLYETKRVEVEVRDGVKVPMSIVYNKKIKQQKNIEKNIENKSNSDNNELELDVENQPVLLYGYGSYGICIDPSFDFKRTTLLDRGFFFCLFVFIIIIIFIYFFYYSSCASLLLFFF